MNPKAKTETSVYPNLTWQKLPYFVVAQLEVYPDFPQQNSMFLSTGLQCSTVSIMSLFGKEQIEALNIEALDIYRVPGFESKGLFTLFHFILNTMRMR